METPMKLSWRTIFGWAFVAGIAFTLGAAIVSGALDFLVGFFGLQELAGWLADRNS